MAVYQFEYGESDYGRGTFIFRFFDRTGGDVYCEFGQRECPGGPNSLKPEFHADALRDSGQCQSRRPDRFHAASGRARAAVAESDADGWSGERLLFGAGGSGVGRKLAADQFRIISGRRDPATSGVVAGAECRSYGWER